MFGLGRRKNANEYVAIPMDSISSSGSETSLFNQNALINDGDSGNVVIYDKRTVQKNLGTKLHKGVGLNKLYTSKNVTPATAMAGDTHFQIFSGQLGAAAGNPNNPITASINKNRMDTIKKDILNNKHESAAYYHRLIKDGVLTRQQADIEHGLHLIEAKEKGELTLDDTKDEGHSGWVAEYPHVGPGNKILPKATNPIDNVARNHDIAYDKAKTKEEIFAADKAFKEEMNKVDTKTWKDTAVKHVSKTAISAKNKIEEITGHVFYPSEVNNMELRKFKSITHLDIYTHGTHKDKQRRISYDLLLHTVSVTFNIYK